MIETISKIDESVIIFIKDYLINEDISRIMIVFSLLGNLAFIWLVISIYLSISEKNKDIFIATAISLVLVLIIVDIILKETIDRERPFEIIKGIELFIKKPSTASFPSGHTASSFAAALVISKFKKKITAYLFVLALLISLSRLYLFLHYPSDVLVGMILGLVFGCISLYLWRKIRH